VEPTGWWPRWRRMRSMRAMILISCWQRQQHRVGCALCIHGVTIQSPALVRVENDVGFRNGLPATCPAAANGKFFQGDFFHEFKLPKDRFISWAASISAFSTDARFFAPLRLRSQETARAACTAPDALPTRTTASSTPSMVTDRHFCFFDVAGVCLTRCSHSMRNAADLSPPSAWSAFGGWRAAAHQHPKVAAVSSRAAQRVAAPGNGGCTGLCGCSSPSSGCPASRAARPLHRFPSP